MALRERLKVMDLRPTDNKSWREGARKGYPNISLFDIQGGVCKCQI
jgi:hypothetical protein